MQLSFIFHPNPSGQRRIYSWMVTWKTAHFSCSLSAYIPLRRLNLRHHFLHGLIFPTTCSWKVIHTFLGNSTFHWPCRKVRLFDDHCPLFSSSFSPPSLLYQSLCLTPPHLLRHRLTYLLVAVIWISCMIRSRWHGGSRLYVRYFVIDCYFLNMVWDRPDIRIIHCVLLTIISENIASSPSFESTSTSYTSKLRSGPMSSDALKHLVRN